MNNLVIGSSSQLSRYFPEDYEKLSSRNINLNYIQSKKWDSVYICYAEQRTYLANSENSDIRNLFWDTNFTSILNLIDIFKPISRKIVYYSTAELWNKSNGPIDISMPFNFYSNHYTDSKKATSFELKNKDKYPNVCVAYPFNFNSIYRGNGYLFGKIFKSIINNEKISVGDLDYYREIIHPSMVVDASISHQEIGIDFIIGSGRLVHIQDFVKQLYKHFNLNYDLMVDSDDTIKSIYRTNLFYSKKLNLNFSSDKVFELTVNEIHTSIKDLYHA